MIYFFRLLCIISSCVYVTVTLSLTQIVHASYVILLLDDDTLRTNYMITQIHLESKRP